MFCDCLSQRPLVLRSGSVALELFGLRVRIPPVSRMFVSCECRMLSSRGLCDGPIPRPDESYREHICDFERAEV
jgi:hypothetical protein